MIKPTEAFDLIVKAINVKAELATVEQKDLLADAKNALADLKMLVADQKLEIDKLKRQVNLEKELIFEKPNYWVQKEKGIKDGPFCQLCKDVEGRLVRKTSNICSQCISKKRY